MKQELPFIKTWDWDREARDLIEVAKQPHHFTDDDGRLIVSGEDGTSFVDYYGEFRGGYPYIHPELEQWAADQGGYWEWRDPGSIVLTF